LEDMQGIRLEGPYWEVAGRHVDPAQFLHALETLVPEGSILFLEGGTQPPPLRAFLDRHAALSDVKVALGTAWPRGRVFHVPTAPTILRELAELADKCASPELCDHLHVYSSEGVLPQWYDAFVDPFYVSKRVPPEQFEAFCGALKTD
jgi:hypothetical protein